ncbi:ABC transporter permease [Corynebacterium sp. c9Ua_112]|uniref:ABC transporter permease n=1 Tax=Corynebacterium macclintockiae TaxID=2913501 RepID=A0A9X3M511_9CORY|nr:FtsX-like permease family protein [Corynebacterium macclintockiae]MCZ9304316.1 ABC transporter permease [Corynebacterium macclintockiae]
MLSNKSLTPVRGFMFQGIRELRVSRGKTALIITTVLLITAMVTLLSSLSAGLSFQSASALQHKVGSDRQLVLNDAGGTVNLSTGSLSDAQARAVESRGGEVVTMARSKDAEGQPFIAMSYKGEKPSEELYLEHQPIHWMSTDEVKDLPGASAFGVVAGDAEPINGAVMMKGKEALNASASYKGEQSSLNLMIVLLYVISALVLGAFFTVWTMQRLRGVAITVALGGTRSNILSDAVGQALVVLIVGIAAGTLMTVGVGGFLDGIPMEVTANTTLVPAGMLLAAGLLGAGLSIIPVTKVDPRKAMNS